MISQGKTLKIIKRNGKTGGLKEESKREEEKQKIMERGVTGNRIRSCK